MINFTQKHNFKKAWDIVRKGLVIKNEKDYDAAIKLLNELLDEIGDNEQHPLYSYLDTLGTVIESYENDHFPIEDCSSRDALKLLMNEHGLTQSDLSQVASQGVISEVLSGKRKLTLRQVKALSKRFHVSADVFIDV